MKFLGIIPARYASSRLEGKPLAEIAGKPMIQHVYEKACQSMDHVCVATDDQRIYEAVKAFGGKVVMTSIDHNTGTNRCLEALEKVEKEVKQSFDAVINIQGDEPMLDPAHLQLLQDAFDDDEVEMATLSVPAFSSEDLDSDSNVFLVFDKNKDALYFSRTPIPTVRGVEKNEWINHATFYKHIGLYAYTHQALKQFASLPQTTLEKLESLEQLRWLENGHKLRVQVVEKHESISVDTPEDLEKVRRSFEL